MQPTTLLVYSTSIAQALLAVVLGVLLMRLHRQYQRDYLRQWARSWFALCVALAGGATAMMGYWLFASSRVARTGLSLVSIIAGYWQAIWLLLGAMELVRREPLSARAQRWYLLGSAVAATALVLLVDGDPERRWVRYFLRVGIRQAGAGVAFIGAGVLVLRLRASAAAQGRRMLGLAFLAYGAEQLHYFVFALLPLLGRAQPDYFAYLGLGDVVLQAAMGLGMVMWLLEEDRAIALQGADETLRAERAMRVSEAGFVAAIESASDAVITIDPGQRVTAFNQAFARRIHETFGRDVRHGDPVGVLLPPGREEQWLPAFERALRGERVRLAFDVQIGPRAVHLELALSPILTDAGITGVIVVTRDVSAARQAVEALRRSEEQFRSLLQNASDIIMVIDADATVRYASPSIEPALGWTPEDLVGKPFVLVHPADLEKARDAMRRTVGQPGDTRQVTLRIRHKNSGWRLCEVLERAVRDEPDGLRVIVNARDITERQHLEEQLLQSQKMESVGRLAGGVAHDFNNLLTAILGHASMARSSLAPAAPIQEELREIELAGNRAATLTRQLLAFARRQVIEPKVIDLNDHVAGMNNMLRRLIGEHIELRTILGRDLWPVRTDPGQFEQVLLNLSVNARDAMAQGGKLTVETSNVALDEAYVQSRPEMTRGDYVLLAVSDTGTGMDEDTMRHVFEPFFTTKAAGLGTGLGLATCYGIVRQAGGYIWAYSELGHGTTFRIYLPRAGEARPEAPAPPPPPTPRGTETILVVEDETMVRTVAARVLRGQGYRVMEASDGAEGVRVADAHEGHIDLVLTDLVMPVMDGRELAKHIRSERPTARVLFMSGYTEAAIVHRDGDAGRIDLLQKPFSPGDLARRVRATLDAPRA